MEPLTQRKVHPKGTRAPQVSSRQATAPQMHPWDHCPCNTTPCCILSQEPAPSGEARRGAVRAAYLEWASTRTAASFEALQRVAGSAEGAAACLAMAKVRWAGGCMLSAQAPTRGEPRDLSACPPAKVSSASRPGPPGACPSFVTRRLQAHVLRVVLDAVKREGRVNEQDAMRGMVEALRCAVRGARQHASLHCLVRRRRGSCCNWWRAPAVLHPLLGIAACKGPPSCACPPPQHHAAHPPALAARPPPRRRSARSCCR